MKTLIEARPNVTVATLLLQLTLPAAVQAQFNYTINNNIITITGYKGTNGLASRRTLSRRVP